MISDVGKASCNFTCRNDLESRKLKLWNELKWDNMM